MTHWCSLCATSNPELKIARGLEGNEFAEKGNDRGGARSEMVAAAGFDLKNLAVFEPSGSKLAEASFSYMESLGELAFFIAPIDRMKLALAPPDFRSLFGGVDSAPYAAPSSRNRKK